jgi:hypothetical protein
MIYSSGKQGGSYYTHIIGHIRSMDDIGYNKGRQGV